MKYTVKEMREQLVHYVQKADVNKVKVLYDLLGNEGDLMEERKRIIRLERESYLKGESATFSTEEIKQMAIDKKKRYAI